MADPFGGNVRNRKANRAGGAKPAVVEEVDTDEAEEIEREREVKEDEAKERRQQKRKRSTRERVDNEDDYSPWLDVLRVLSLLAIVSCGLSWLVSGGESFTWGLRHPPKYLNKEWWKAQFRGPIYLTLDELAQYDGRNTSLPLYLAINGTIYDVSANRRIYGPGGGYQFFAGTDASRSFVTGCFAEDRTADMRGAEEMYLPLEDPEFDAAHWSPAELDEIRRRERERALQKVHEALLHWARFFDNNDKYPRIGYVQRDPDWLEKEPRRKLCEAAAKQRKRRQVPGEE